MWARFDLCVLGDLTKPRYIMRRQNLEDELQRHPLTLTSTALRNCPATSPASGTPSPTGESTRQEMVEWIRDKNGVARVHGSDGSVSQVGVVDAQPPYVRTRRLRTTAHFGSREL
jgi:hypothetical protein